MKNAKVNSSKDNSKETAAIVAMPTDLEKAGLKGPVKQEKQTSYKAHKISGMIIQGKIETDSIYARTNYIVTYNESGTKIQEQLFGRNDFKLSYYNNKGLQTESIQCDLKGTINQKTLFIYSDKGHLLEYISRNADDSLINKTCNKYNEEGKILESIYYNADEIINKKSIFKYNEQGNLLSYIDYDKDGNINYQKTQKYDERGFLIEQISQYSEKRMMNYNNRFEYVNNEHGDCIEFTSYKADGSIDRVYTYTHQYDSDGNKIIPERSPAKDSKAAWETEELEYDVHGNWIKKTTFYHQIPQNIYIREITYFGEEKQDAQTLVHPLMNATDKEVKERTEPAEEMSGKKAQWLVENTTADNFPVLRYYALLYKEPPSLITYTGPNIEVLALLNELTDNMGAEMVHSYSTNWAGQGETMVRYTLNFPHKGYMIHVPNISAHDVDEFEVPEFISDMNIFDNCDVYFSQVQLLHPSDASGKRDDFFEEEIREYIDKCMLQKTPDKPTINMIEATNNGFTIKEHAVDDKFEIKDLDVNYGYGFSKFHNELMKRFNTSSKGLVLFHGMPGTGKTYYIRHLLRKMTANKKVVIYMPPNMVDHMVEPVFITFLSRKIQEWASDGNFCVLLIEDAEPLLARRQEGVRIQGITNLLNMSDGILNDMLNLQIICTFNVDLKKLDNALLRPGRLIARKEFKPLSEIDANVLAKRLGIDHHFTAPVVLGEIYAMMKNKNTLVHDVDYDKNGTTILDDLL